MSMRLRRATDPEPGPATAALRDAGRRLRLGELARQPAARAGEAALRSVGDAVIDAAFNWGRKGRGCSHCEPGVAMSWFKTGSHIVALCMNCLMEWFPGRSVEWLEERIDYYSDHVGYKFAVERVKGRDRPVPTPESFARYPVRDEETGRWTEREKP